ncbi:MAG: hypothetical protein ACR2G4_10735 [Pyrinomonadaceae bacterium]
MCRFNWIKLLATIAAAAGTSLLLSLDNNKLSGTEILRAVIQAFIAAAAFVEQPRDVPPSR